MMTRLTRSFCLLGSLALGLALALALLHVASGVRAGGAWSDPSVLWPELWDDPLYADLDDAGSRLTALIPYSGANDNNRSVVATEKSGDAWGEPVVIATNGAWSDASFQWLPQGTHPVISGDGNTIAYVGYTGSTFAVYISDREAGGWGAPVMLNTGLENHHYWISISQDGDTLAYADYPFWGIQRLYVSTRTGGVWGPKVRISDESGLYIGGGNPSLSADGRSLVYIANTQVMVTNKKGAIWDTPQPLTDHDPATTMAEFPQISADGAAVFYWLVTLTPQGSYQVRSAQDLYLQRWDGASWSAPQKVNDTWVLPSSVTDAPAAADAHATRIMYTRPLTVTDPGDGHVYINASQLEISEWRPGGWRSSLLVDSTGYGNYNKWPLLTPDGLMLVFEGGIRYTPDPVYQALWQMNTQIAPPPVDYGDERVFLPLVNRGP